jgi:hypothetical protein
MSQVVKQNAAQASPTNKSCSEINWMSLWMYNCNEDCFMTHQHLAKWPTKFSCDSCQCLSWHCDAPFTLISFQLCWIFNVSANSIIVQHKQSVISLWWVSFLSVFGTDGPLMAPSLVAHVFFAFFLDTPNHHVSVATLFHHKFHHRTTDRPPQIKMLIRESRVQASLKHQQSTSSYSMTMICLPWYCMWLGAIYIPYRQIFTPLCFEFEEWAKLEAS